MKIFINSFKNLINKKPIISSIIILAFYLAMNFGFKFLLLIIDKKINIGEEEVKLIQNIFSILLPLFLTYLLGFDYIFKLPDFLKTLQIMMPYSILYTIATVVILVYMLSMPDLRFDIITFLVALTEIFGIGFREEVIFRGIIGNAIGHKYCKTEKGVIFAVSITAIIFGGIHILNIFAGVKIYSLIIQTIVAIAAGFYLTACYFRGRSLWAMIYIHSAIDFMSLGATYMDSGISSVDVINNLSIVNLTPVLLFLAISLYILRQSKIYEVIDNFK